MRSGCCRCSFEKQPEGRSRRSAKGAGMARRARAERKSKGETLVSERARTGCNSHCRPTPSGVKSASHSGRFYGSSTGCADVVSRPASADAVLLMPPARQMEDSCLLYTSDAADEEDS